MRCALPATTAPAHQGSRRQSAAKRLRFAAHRLHPAKALHADTPQECFCDSRGPEPRCPSARDSVQESERRACAALRPEHPARVSQELSCIPECLREEKNENFFPPEKIGAQSVKRRKINVPLVPPKPNELDSATSIFILRAVFGT